MNDPSVYKKKKVKTYTWTLLHGLETVEQFIPMLFTCFVVISFKIVSWSLNFRRTFYLSEKNFSRGVATF